MWPIACRQFVKYRVKGFRIWFSKEQHSLIMVEKIVRAPCLLLGFDGIPHYSGVSQESQKAKLCKPAEVSPAACEPVEPLLRGQVMYVCFIGEGDPNIDVREIGLH